MFKRIYRRYRDLTCRKSLTEDRHRDITAAMDEVPSFKAIVLRAGSPFTRAS